nr:transposase, mutator type [Tanacetum cinerariifolium]
MMSVRMRLLMRVIMIRLRMRMVIKVKTIRLILGVKVKRMRLMMGGQSEEDDRGDDEDKDIKDIVDEKHIVDEVEFQMNGFKFKGKGKYAEPMQPKLSMTETDLKVLNFDLFESDVDDAKESAKRKGLRKLRKEAGNSTLKTSFFVKKEFANRDLAKEMVRAHVAKTRKNIMIVKKDQIRIRVKCFGVVPVTVKMTKQMIMNIGKEILDHEKK